MHSKNKKFFGADEPKEVGNKNSLKVVNFQRIDVLAERERFELSVAVSHYDGLANRWFQPLTHLSVLKTF